MIQASVENPLEGFAIHGVKTVSSYDYYLLVDDEGQCLIQRVASDDSEFKFVRMPTPSSKVFADIATAIDAFWVSPDSYQYKYLFQC